MLPGDDPKPFDLNPKAGDMPAEFAMLLGTFFGVAAWVWHILVLMGLHSQAVAQGLVGWVAIDAGSQSPPLLSLLDFLSSPVSDFRPELGYPLGQWDSMVWGMAVGVFVFLRCRRRAL